MENPVTVLPEPDSPTSPRTSPEPNEKLTSSTALATPSRVKKWVWRLRTSRVGWGMELQESLEDFSKKDSKIKSCPVKIVLVFMTLVLISEALD
jgi:hypothetical protein